MANEHFQFRQFIVWQDRCAMKVGTDGTLLGAWSQAPIGECRILDIGTGTALVALMMAQRYPLARLTAIDIDGDAVEQAQDNVMKSPFSTRITVLQADVRNMPGDEEFDAIVSNPPYICESERQSMHINVTGHEPEEALFVGDDDPLLFYHAISHYASHALRPDGALYFEINPLYAEALLSLMRETGFNDVTLIEDSFGKQRYVKARK